MNWQDWYTDIMDVWRNVNVQDGAITRKERRQVLTGVPCRIYQSGSKAIRFTQTASDVHQEDKLACDIPVKILAGDELIVTRGGALGNPGPVVRAFASDPNFYYEPFGAVIPGLSHQEIRLLERERVKGEEEDGL